MGKCIYILIPWVLGFGTYVIKKKPDKNWDEIKGAFYNCSLERVVHKYFVDLEKIVDSIIASLKDQGIMLDSKKIYSLANISRGL